MKVFKRSILILIFVIASAFIMCGCKSKNKESITINSLEDIHKGVRIGLQTGSLDETIYLKDYKDECEAFYFSAISDQVVALKNNKIDVFFLDEFMIKSIVESEPGIEALPESALNQDIAAIFAKTGERADKYRLEFNEFLEKLKADGTLEQMKNDWYKNQDLKEAASPIEGNNGIVYFGTSADTPPFSFVRDGKLQGFEADLAYRFCNEHGYTAKMNIMDFDALIPAVTSGKIDMAIACFGVTEERKESVAFSIPYAVSGMYPIVRSEVVEVSFFQKIANSFKKTFIVEQRWQMILKGIATTLFITILSAIFGSVLGFLLYMLCRKKGKTFLKILNGVCWIIASLPVVVLLMVLFYVIFGNASVSGVWISIIAFSLHSAFSIYTSLKSSVDAIDKGQLEGAYSIGCSDTKAFFKIILPQALNQFIPEYKGILISLLQGTAIVGYIAVEDLTKMSDIIRGRTYEAFFPIISTAFIYLLLCWLLKILVEKIHVGITAKSKTKEQIIKRFEK